MSSNGHTPPSLQMQHLWPVADQIQLVEMRRQRMRSFLNRLQETCPPEDYDRFIESCRDGSFRIGDLWPRIVTTDLQAAKLFLLWYATYDPELVREPLGRIESYFASG